MKNKKGNVAVLAIIIAVVAITACAFGWMFAKKTQAPSQQAVTTQQAPVAQQPAQPVATQKEGFAAVKAGYKEVQASDGAIAFSFEVPEKWLTETRHDGDRQLTIEEMRDFLATNYDGDIKSKEVCEVVNEINTKTGATKAKKLCSVPTSDYSGFGWDGLKKMSAEEIKSEYFRIDSPFPTASVAKNDGTYKAIWYTDWNAEQIDFTIMSTDQMILEISDSKKMAKESGDESFQQWTTEKVANNDAVVLYSIPEKDARGQDVITKGSTGGKIYYITIGNTGKGLKVSKQAKIPGQYTNIDVENFENVFVNILQTLQIKN